MDVPGGNYHLGGRHHNSQPSRRHQGEALTMDEQILR